MSALRGTLATTLLVILSCLVSRAQGTGSIEGTVTDQRGAPVPEAQVNANSLGGGQIMGSMVRFVATDASGHFVLRGLSLGRYGVFAMKEQALYPDMSSSFYSNNVFPEVTITSSRPVAKVRIRLGSKAGILTGSVTDAETGKPVLAGIDLKRVAAPNEWLSTSIPAQYRILIPSSADVSIAFEAPGYEKWTFTGPINLQPGQEMRLDVGLEPAFNPNLSISEFLIPDGYVGWVLLAYKQKTAPPVLISEGTRIYKFPETGRLKTSSSGPQREARKMYLFYSSGDTTREVPMDYRNGQGMIWGEYEGTLGGVISEYGFFVGTHEQYEQAKNRRPFQ